MLIDLILRGEKSSPLDFTEHEFNLTSIQSANNVHHHQISSLTVAVSSRMVNLSDDKSPELGGPLDGQNNTVRRVADFVGFKTQPFTYLPNDGRVINYTGVSDAVVTMPTNLGVCPLGTGVELHVTAGVTLTIQTDQTSPTVQRPRNYDGHHKIVGPFGQAFLRVVDAVASKAIWTLAGNTAP